MFLGTLHFYHAAKKWLISSLSALLVFLSHLGFFMDFLEVFLISSISPGCKHGRTEGFCVTSPSAVAGNKKNRHWCGFPCYPGFHKQGPRGPLSVPCLLQQTSLSVIRNSFAVCIRHAYCHDCSAVIVNNSSASKCTTNVPFHPWKGWKIFISSLPLTGSFCFCAPFASLIQANYCCCFVPKGFLPFTRWIQFG